ncbi:MAG: Gfo/Idh/MocA family oxidoreductase, partial [Acidimicrobiia bacterium]|nr:Gfo/Idh/MocA family oxidoreductase [Acidimicrobiia bacterium]
GAISHEHLSFLAGRTTVGPVGDRVRLAAVCDLSPTAGAFASAEFGAETSHTDLTEMLETARPDVVHVLTPPETHPVLVAQALDAGADVICEKPITPDLATLDELLAKASARGRRLIESHNYRFNESIRRIRNEIDAGALGPVREVEIRIVLPVTDPAGRFGDPNLPNPIHRMPAGVIHDFTTHFAYLVRHLAPGVDYRRVAAAWSRHDDNALFRYDDLDALLIGEGPDGAVHARLRFDARSAPDSFTVTVRGADGFAETDLFQPYVRFVRPRPGGAKISPIVNHLAGGATLLTAGVRNLGQKLLQHGPYEGLHRMLDEIYTALATGKEPPITTDDLRSASELVDLLLDERVAL